MWPFKKRVPKPKPVEHYVIHSIRGPAAREIAELYVKFQALEKGLDLVARMDLWAKIFTVIPETPGRKYTMEAYLGLATAFEIHEEWTEGQKPRDVHIINTNPPPEHA